MGALGKIEEKQRKQLGTNKNNSASFKKTYGVGWSLQAVGFGAALVPDLPRHDAGDPVRDLFPGDLAILSPGWVPMTPVLEGRVDPLLYWLREWPVEGDGHRSPRQARAVKSAISLRRSSTSAISSAAGGSS